MTPNDDSLSRADASSSRFAAMLANAIEPQKTEYRAPAEKDRSSDLESSDDSEEARSEKASASHTEKNSTDATSAANAAAAALGRPAAGLDTTLRAKLARVIERMRDEEGKTVTVAEGVRSQTRQNALYAQGRTADGPVVTWTRNSLHGKGLAADLVIDGGFSDQGGFDALRRIAEEEGLHTLGKIDPGHVELRGARTMNALDSLPALRSDKDSSSVLGLASRAKIDAGTVTNAALRAVATPLAAVPQVARVAATAKVATVATVASVAVAGAAAGINSAKSAGTGSGRSDSRAGGDKQDDRSSGGIEMIGMDGSIGDRAYAAFGTSTSSSITADVQQISGPDTPQGTTHVDRVLDIQDARGAKSISHLSLSVDDGKGGQDTVRVGLRGNSVGASFDIRDAGSADRVASRLGELTRALERRGLEPQTFQVRSASSSQDGSAVTTRTATAQAVSTDGAAMRQQDQAGARGDSRQAFGQQGEHQEQQERARDRSDDRRRRDSTFSLTQEEA
ncbi:MAG: peptidase and DD-carboxypeptidase VanY/endolysin [Gemmatimonadetes bacterium]|nr:peptidase and DD-carboxypeptidase VanY/endolysin [Gemmatimonadota bacterium]